MTQPDCRGNWDMQFSCVSGWKIREVRWLYSSILCHHYFFFFLIYLFIYLWLCWVSASVRGPSPAAASGGHSSSRCAGPSPSRPLLLRSTGSRRAGSVIVAHGPSCSAARGILPDQGPNPCPLHWQADSQPLRHQGSPVIIILISFKFNMFRNELHPQDISRIPSCLTTAPSPPF